MLDALIHWNDAMLQSSPTRRTFLKSLAAFATAAVAPLAGSGNAAGEIQPITITGPPVGGTVSTFPGNGTVQQAIDRIPTIGA